MGACCQSVPARVLPRSLPGDDLQEGDLARLRHLVQAKRQSGAAVSGSVVSSPLVRNISRVWDAPPPGGRSSSRGRSMSPRSMRVSNSPPQDRSRGQSSPKGKVAAASSSSSPPPPGGRRGRERGRGGNKRSPSSASGGGGKKAGLQRSPTSLSVSSSATANTPRPGQLPPLPSDSLLNTPSSPPRLSAGNGSPPALTPSMIETTGMVTPTPHRLAGVRPSSLVAEHEPVAEGKATGEVHGQGQEHQREHQQPQGWNTSVAAVGAYRPVEPAAAAAAREQERQALSMVKSPAELQEEKALLARQRRQRVQPQALDPVEIMQRQLRKQELEQQEQQRERQVQQERRQQEQEQQQRMVMEQEMDRLRQQENEREEDAANPEVEDMVSMLLGYDSGQSRQKEQGPVVAVAPPRRKKDAAAHRGAMLAWEQGNDGGSRARAQTQAPQQAQEMGSRRPPLASEGVDKEVPPYDMTHLLQSLGGDEERSGRKPRPPPPSKPHSGRLFGRERALSSRSQPSFRNLHVKHFGVTSTPRWEEPSSLQEVFDLFPGLRGQHLPTLDFGTQTDMVHTRGRAVQCSVLPQDTHPVEEPEAAAPPAPPPPETSSVAVQTDVLRSPSPGPSSCSSTVGTRGAGQVARRDEGTAKRASTSQPPQVAKGAGAGSGQQTRIHAEEEEEEEEVQEEEEEEEEDEEEEEEECFPAPAPLRVRKSGGGGKNGSTSAKGPDVSPGRQSASQQPSPKRDKQQPQHQAQRPKQRSPLRGQLEEDAPEQEDVLQTRPLEDVHPPSPSPLLRSHSSAIQGGALPELRDSPIMRQRSSSSLSLGHSSPTLRTVTSPAPGDSARQLTPVLPEAHSPRRLRGSTSSASVAAAAAAAAAADRSQLNSSPVLLVSRERSEALPNIRKEGGTEETKEGARPGVDESATRSGSADDSEDGQGQVPEHGRDGEEEDQEEGKSQGEVEIRPNSELLRRSQLVDGDEDEESSFDVFDDRRANAEEEKPLPAEEEVGDLDTDTDAGFLEDDDGLPVAEDMAFRLEFLLHLAVALQSKYLKLDMPAYVSMLRMLPGKYPESLLQALGDEMLSAVVTPEAVMHEALQEFGRFECTQEEDVIRIWQGACHVIQCAESLGQVAAESKVDLELLVGIVDCCCCAGEILESLLQVILDGESVLTFTSTFVSAMHLLDPCLRRATNLSGEVEDAFLSEVLGSVESVMLNFLGSHAQHVADAAAAVADGGGIDSFAEWLSTWWRDPDRSSAKSKEFLRPLCRLSSILWKHLPSVVTEIGNLFLSLSELEGGVVCCPWVGPGVARSLLRCLRSHPTRIPEVLMQTRASVQQGALAGFDLEGQVTGVEILLWEVEGLVDLRSSSFSSEDLSQTCEHVLSMVSIFLEQSLQVLDGDHRPAADEKEKEEHPKVKLGASSLLKLFLSKGLFDTLRRLLVSCGDVTQVQVQHLSSILQRLGPVTAHLAPWNPNVGKGPLLFEQLLRLLVALLQGLLSWDTREDVQDTFVVLVSGTRSRMQFSADDYGSLLLVIDCCCSIVNYLSTLDDSKDKRIQEAVLSFRIALANSGFVYLLGRWIGEGSSEEHGEALDNLCTLLQFLIMQPRQAIDDFGLTQDITTEQTNEISVVFGFLMVHELVKRTLSASPVLSLLTLSALFLSHTDYHVEAREMYQMAREAASAMVAGVHSFKDLDVAFEPICWKGCKVYLADILDSLRPFCSTDNGATSPQVSMTAEDEASNKAKRACGLYSKDGHNLYRVELLVLLLRAVPEKTLYSQLFLTPADLSLIIEFAHRVLEWQWHTEPMDSLVRTDARVRLCLELLGTLDKRNSFHALFSPQALYHPAIDRHFAEYPEDMDTLESQRGDSSSSSRLASSASAAAFKDGTRPTLRAVQFFLKRAPFLVHIGIKKRLFNVALQVQNPPLVLKARRDDLFHSSLKSWMAVKRVDLKRQLKVAFDGENTVDIQGVKREYLTLLAREIVKPEWKLFVPCTDGSFRPNPMSGQGNPDHLRWFEFVGRFLGKILFEKTPIELHLSVFVIKRLLDLRLCYFDVAGIDDQYFENTVSWIRDNDITNVLMLTFQENGVPLCKDGERMPVTNENKRQYLDLLVEFKLKHEVEAQLRSMAKGFNDVIPLEHVQGFAPLEVDMLIAGMDVVDVQDMAEHTEFLMGYSQESETVQVLWKVLQEWDHSMRAKFLKFVTGCPRVSLGGFADLHPPLTIQQVSDIQKLPAAQTCFNRLKLPDYRNEEVLRQKLEMAVQEAHEGFSFS